MKNNVINPSYQIEMQAGGILAIIGKTNHRVVFLASGLFLYGGENLEGFAKNPIFTRLLSDTGSAIIFEYNLQGELRNPRKLLKSVRNKLMRTINAAHSAFEDEMNQLEHEVSHAYHSRNYRPETVGQPQA